MSRLQLKVFDCIFNFKIFIKLAFSSSDNSDIDVTDNFTSKQKQDKNKKKSLNKIVSHNDPLKKYEIMEKVGSGGAGDVYRAVFRQTGLQVAIKKIYLAKQDLKDIINEIKGIKKVFNIFQNKK
jgi:hypothetical protein